MPSRALLLLLGLASLAAADPTTTPKTADDGAAAPTQPTGESTATSPRSDTDALFDAGKSLFDEYAPAEIKEQFDFPTKQQWDDFAVRLQRALDGDSLQDLAAYETEARAALAALQALPDYEDYAPWLSQKIELIAAAKTITQQRPPLPGEKIPPVPHPAIPQYDFWLQRLKNTSAPANAKSLVPLLETQFSSAGTPKELLWLAEVESGFNPAARNPSGARGLYQLMPDTAKGLGLSTWMPDDRSDPGKSGRAAAQLLARLYSKFGDWPLALAAYNAGEGRVSRALAKRKAKTFEEIASALSVETRLYVPKVMATVETRTGRAADALPAAK